MIHWWHANHRCVLRLHPLSLPTQLVIALEPSLSQRHTGENIAKWTDEALESIGLTESELLGLQAKMLLDP